MFVRSKTRSAIKAKEDFIMLVLSRKEGERIVIGDNITLIVSKVSGNRLNAPTSEKVEPKPISLREFAASVLPLQRQVG